MFSPANLNSKREKDKKRLLPFSFIGYHRQKSGRLTGRILIFCWLMLAVPGSVSSSPGVNSVQLATPILDTRTVGKEMCSSTTLSLAAPNGFHSFTSSSRLIPVVYCLYTSRWTKCYLTGHDNTTQQ